MRGRLLNSALLVLGLALAPLAGQSPTGKPGQQAQGSAQQQSQPGAQGQSIPVRQAAVPVPPGPVPPHKIKPAPPTPIAVKKVELRGDNPWDPQWDVLIEENLPQELLSPEMARDVRPFCPRFEVLSEANKRSFWAYFFQALAGAEAGLKPTADVRHTDPAVAVIDPVTHHTVRQEGLLQLTYEDSERYGCDFDWDADKSLPEHDPGKTILQPKNNLLCGIRILKNQLIDLHEPLLTQKSYWSTLRPGTLSYRVFARQMENVPQACGARTVRRMQPVAPPVREAFAGPADNGAGSAPAPMQ